MPNTEGTIMSDIEFTLNEDLPPASMLDDGYIHHCETCGTGLTYGGRGRKPRFCNDHKPGASRTPSGGGTSKRDQMITTTIDAAYQIIGQALASPLVPFGNEVAGAVVASHSTSLAEAWVEASKTNVKLRKTLERMCEQSGMATVVALHIGMVVEISNAQRAYVQVANE
jgi:hypothetical protein